MNVRDVTIKICGVRTPEAALAAARAGADLIGLILVPSSRRYVGGVTEARAIVQAIRQAYPTPIVPGGARNQAIPVGWHALQSRQFREDRRAAGLGPAIVGVFQDMEAGQMAQWTSAIGLDCIQLHGSEPAGMESSLPRPVIRVFHVDVPGVGKVSEDGEEERMVEEVRLAANLQVEGHWALALLDARVGQAAGGQGKVFDWKIASRLAERAPNTPFILAGGLTISGVEEAIRQIRPWGVDVSSGVEGPDGRQDLGKITSFIQAARRAAESS
ncbi:hypothetical protein BJ684DRAFT_9439 [Piptocephalis cylindrospora]|uniref:N-(5'-phosphoribosyl)anthranilate isomerase n=1 Tax=Piptocephalis cylindrospora TaxID=1907219 RepID=A0A4P9Y7J0_9FUNG|nr:hypothetical protein BJ684DRAFT_9439 [Piptocephalis cylindrospora]|eukprot:RKP13880.1 hypothetical protein BJ684DRAFT_9439 [Piptocephalis cylindrospora]